MVRAFIFACLLSPGGAAQALSLSAGPIFGLNLYRYSLSHKITTVSSSQFDYDYNTGSGWAYGLTSEVGFTSMLFVQIDGLHSHKKGKGNGQRVSADWLDVPVLAKVKFPLGKPFVPFVHLGPVMSFKLFEDFDVSNFKNFLWGLSFGGGVDYNVIEEFLVFADLRVQRALTSPVKDPSLAPGQTGVVPLRYESALYGWEFFLGARYRFF